MKKRIISIAVSLCTVLSLFPVSAHAEEMNTPKPLYSNAGGSVSGNESISGNNAQNAASQENNILTAVENVQAMLNTLPSVESLEGADDATVIAAYEAAQNAYDAIEELEAEEIALLTGMEKLSALMDWFNGQVMALEGENTVSTEEQLKSAVATNGAVITLNADIALTEVLEINYDNPTSGFSTKIKTNNHILTGNIKLNGCTLTVDGALDADVEANYKENSQSNSGWWGAPANLYGGTYNGEITLNDSKIQSGVYNGKITGTGIISNGTFNDTVTCKNINDGVFYKTCTVPDGVDIYIKIGIFYTTPAYSYKQISHSGYSYYITYKDGDNTYATEYLLHDSALLLKTTNTLTDPTKTAFTFEGWYKDSDCTEAFDRTSLSTDDFTDGNLTLYAKWTHNNVHVDENADRKCDICNVSIAGDYLISGDVLTVYSGTNFSDTSVLTGITKIINYGTLEGMCPEAITKIINYGTIGGGYSSPAIENKETGYIDYGLFGENVTNTGTIGGGDFYGSVTNTGTIGGGTFLNEVTNNGVIKGGGFIENVINTGTIGGGKFNSNKSLSGIYTVTFDSKGGRAVDKQWRANAPALKPTDPTNGSKTFCGWVIKNNDDSYSLYDFSANVTENITLYANWDCELTGHTNVNPKDHNCDICRSNLACEDVSPKDHKCDFCNSILSTCSGGNAATCIKKSVCDYCGKEYGSLDENNHTLKHYQKNAATESASGNKEYWQCTGCGKLFADENGTKDAKPENITIKKLPVMLEGMGQSINAGENKELTFRSDAEISDFICVKLDGNTVDAKNYTVREGSTIITLNAEYVASLPKGNHTISIVSTNGTASASFALLEESPSTSSSNEKANTPANEPVVTKASEKTSPATGDDSHVGLWMAIMIVGVFLIRNAECGIRNYRQKK